MTRVHSFNACSTSPFEKATSALALTLPTEAAVAEALLPPPSEESTLRRRMRKAVELR